jgi:hypothetical protein
MRNNPTAKELARFKCNDCDANVVTIGEVYMCPKAIWDGELGLGLDDNLCIGCLETRLGRRVRAWIDIQLPVYTGQQRPLSDRMADRFGLKRRARR